MILYLISVLIGCGIAVFGNNSFTFLEPVVADSGVVITEGVVYLFSPLQCAVFLIPFFLISFYILERRISGIEQITEPRLDSWSYKTKNILAHLINCMLYVFLTTLAVFVGNIVSGISVPVIVAVESFIAKLIYMLVISMVLEIIKIFRINLLLSCFMVYGFVLAEYLLTYSYQLITGVLFPYAVYRINLTGSYVYLVIWLIAVLTIYIVCRTRIQEFYDAKQA